MRSDIFGVVVLGRKMVADKMPSHFTWTMIWRYALRNTRYWKPHWTSNFNSDIIWALHLTWGKKPRWKRRKSDCPAAGTLVLELTRLEKPKVPLSTIKPLQQPAGHAVVFARVWGSREEVHSLRLSWAKKVLNCRWAVIRGLTRSLTHQVQEIKRDLVTSGHLRGCCGNTLRQSHVASYRVKSYIRHSETTMEHSYRIENSSART